MNIRKPPFLICCFILLSNLPLCAADLSFEKNLYLRVKLTFLKEIGVENEDQLTQEDLKLTLRLAEELAADSLYDQARTLLWDKLREQESSASEKLIPDHPWNLETSSGIEYYDYGVEAIRVPGDSTTFTSPWKGFLKLNGSWRDSLIRAANLIDLNTQYLYDYLIIAGHLPLLQKIDFLYDGIASLRVYSAEDSLNYGEGVISLGLRQKFPLLTTTLKGRIAPRYHQRAGAGRDNYQDLGLLVNLDWSIPVQWNTSLEGKQRNYLSPGVTNDYWDLELINNLSGNLGSYFFGSLLLTFYQKNTEDSLKDDSENSFTINPYLSWELSLRDLLDATGEWVQSRQHQVLYDSAGRLTENRQSLELAWQHDFTDHHNLRLFARLENNQTRDPLATETSLGENDYFRKGLGSALDLNFAKMKINVEGEYGIIDYSADQNDYLALADSREISGALSFQYNILKNLNFNLSAQLFSLSEISKSRNENNFKDNTRFFEINLKHIL